jgi:quercetin dioxygenase-like cupin family protein
MFPVMSGPAVAHPVTLESGAAHELGGLVHYSPGAVVSRTLAQTPAGTLTLFAFDADQGLSEHSAPFDAWVLLVEGRATLTIGGRAVPVESGQLVVMPASVPHAVTANERCKLLLVMFKSSAIA